MIEISTSHYLLNRGCQPPWFHFRLRKPTAQLQNDLLYPDCCSSLAYYRRCTHVRYAGVQYSISNFEVCCTWRHLHGYFGFVDRCHCRDRFPCSSSTSTSPTVACPAGRATGYYSSRTLPRYAYLTLGTPCLTRVHLAAYPRTYNPSFATGACVLAVVFASAYALIFPLVGPAVTILLFLTLIGE